MPNKISIKEQVFNDFKEKIDLLSKVNSVDELLQNEESFQQLQNLFTTLKVIRPLKEIEVDESTIAQEEVFFGKIELDTHEDSTEDSAHELVEDEELSVFDESFNNDDEIIEEENTEFSIDPQEESEITDDTIDVIHESNAEIEIQNKEEVKTHEEPIEEIQNSEEITKLESSRVKLSNIKGVKANALFEEEELEEMAEDPTQDNTSERISTNSGKQDFKLDLNDKIAFTKILFDGRQTELNETIRVLNSFEKIEEAQEYLSDMYYRKNWDKVEEYAQRLWSLVENKFH